jgi:hypothetical protein
MWITTSLRGLAGGNLKARDTFFFNTAFRN